MFAEKSRNYSIAELIMPLIEKLKENYPRRSAFIDELEKLKAKI